MSNFVATPKSPVTRPDGIPVPIVVLAWLHIVLSAAGLIAGACFCLQFWIVPDWLSNFVLAFAIPIFIFLSMVLFLPALVGGIGLLRGKTWARIVIFLLSIVMIFVFPIGTILGGFGIMALRAEGTPSADPMTASTTADFRASRSAALLCGTVLGLAGFGATCLIVMGIVFWDRPDVSPVSADTFNTAVVILTGSAIAAALWWVVATFVRHARRPGELQKNRTGRG